jgi:PIN domain nuclease of toxin-antitoxin system
MSEPVLMDTHVLVWWKAGGQLLSTHARHAVETSDRLLVSPVSCWEVAMLVRKGRIALDRPVRMWINDVLASGRVAFAELTADIAVAAAELDSHGDPADRMIYATAQALNVPLVTKDRRLRGREPTSGAVRIVW